MSKQRTYTGHSGQLAVMAELLFRQCNVAVPEVDWGVDAFAFVDEREEITRLQIKTAQGERYKTEEGFSAQFDLPLAQLNVVDRPPLYYILAVRLENQFATCLVVSRQDIDNFRRRHRRFGTENRASGNLVLTVQFRPQTVRCGEVDLTVHRDAWERLPPLQPQPVSTAGATAPLGSSRPDS